MTSDHSPTEPDRRQPPPVNDADHTASSFHSHSEMHPPELLVSRPDQADNVEEHPAQPLAYPAAASRHENALSIAHHVRLVPVVEPFGQRIVEPDPLAISQMDTHHLPRATTSPMEGSTAADNQQILSKQHEIRNGQLGAAGQVAWNTVLQSVGRLLGYASALLVVGFTTRLLSVGQYGDYTIAMVYLGFVSVLADFGVKLIAVREAAKEPELLPRIAGDAIALKLLISFIAYGASTAVMYLVLPYSVDVKVATSILAVSMFFISWANGLDIIYQVRLRMEAPTFADLGLKIFTLVGIGLLLLLHQFVGIGHIAAFYSVVSITAAGNILSFVLRLPGLSRVSTVRWGIYPRQWTRLFLMAVPMGIVALLGQIHYKVDTIILSLLKPAQDVAVYGVAYKLVDFLLMFYGIFVSMAFPVLAQYSTDSEERVKDMLGKVLDVAIAVSLPAACGTIVLAPGIMRILGGGDYAPAATALQILSIAPIFSLINMVYNYVIVVRNRQSSLIWVSCIGILANVTLNLWAIPRYSYLGSAVATDVTECLGMILSVAIAIRIVPAGPTVRATGKSLIASTVMVVALIGLELGGLRDDSILATLALITTGAIVWALATVLIGGIDDEIAVLVVRRIPFGAVVWSRLRPHASSQSGSNR